MPRCEAIRKSSILGRRVPGESFAEVGSAAYDALESGTLWGSRSRGPGS